MIYIGSSLFPEVISTNILIGNFFIVFRITVQCEGIFFTFPFFFLKSKKTFSLLCSNPLITSIMFHIRGFNAYGNVSYVLDHYVKTDVLFLHFGELKITFFTPHYFVFRGMY